MRCGALHNLAPLALTPVAFGRECGFRLRQTNFLITLPQSKEFALSISLCSSHFVERICEIMNFPLQPDAFNLFLLRLLLLLLLLLHLLLLLFRLLVHRTAAVLLFLRQTLALARCDGRTTVPVSQPG